jgi:hypothetical protein
MPRDKHETVFIHIIVFLSFVSGLLYRCNSYAQNKEFDYVVQHYSQG